MHTLRTLFVAGLAGAALLVGAVPASAHVTIPGTAEQGGFGIVTFSVPNERDDSGTVSLEVQLPQDVPLAFVSLQPKPGWEVSSTTRDLDEPIEVSGNELTQVTDTVTWEGGLIEPGQFDTFSISVGPLPEDRDLLGFPAIQTYESGEEVAWVEETPPVGEEPELPMPVLRLVPPEGEGEAAPVAETIAPEGTEVASAGESGDTAASAGDAASSSARGPGGLTIAALVVAVLALLLAGLSLRRPRGTAPQ